MIRVPGTKFRFGLDPLIGLIPGIGDTRLGLGFRLCPHSGRAAWSAESPSLRMALNILVNEIIGIVPVVGDAFSFWFKSNARNYEIIKTHRLGPECGGEEATGFLSSASSSFVFSLSLVVASLSGIVR